MLGHNGRVLYVCYDGLCGDDGLDDVVYLVTLQVVFHGLYGLLARLSEYTVLTQLYEANPIFSASTLM